MLIGEYAASGDDLEPGDRVKVEIIAQCHEDGMLRAAWSLGTPQQVLDRGGAVRLLGRGDIVAPDSLIVAVLGLLDLPDTPMLRELAADGLRAGLARIVSAQ